MITWSDISTITRALLRWWWVVVVAVALATGSAWYIGRQNEERFYLAKATLMIGTSFESTAPDAGEIGVSNGLAHFYAELARREPILQPVQQKLQLPFSWDYVAAYMLGANIVSNANLLEVQITDTNPDRAALIANAIGEQLINSSPSSPEKIKAQQDVVEQQLNDSSAKINQLRSKVSELTDLRLKATSASDATEINGQLTQFSLSLSEEEAAYRSLLGLKNGATINSLSFVERAAPAAAPLPSKRLLAVAVAGMAGLLLALLAVLVLERLDPRWRGASDVRNRFKLRHLGAVPLGAPLLASAGDAATRRETAMHAAYTNVLLAATESQTHTIVVSSAKPTDQRTAVALDMASLFARAGHNVLLVGTDGCSLALNNLLLTTPLYPNLELVLANDSTPHLSHTCAQIRPTIEPQLMLLPVLPNANSTPQIAPTLRLPELASQLASLAEVIIFDGPSALDGAAAALLAPTVDGTVLVLAPSDTRADVFRSRDRLLNQPSARILGAITLQRGSRRDKAAQATTPWTYQHAPGAQTAQALLNAPEAASSASAASQAPLSATQQTDQPASLNARAASQRRVKRGRGGHVLKPEIAEQAA